MKKLHQDMVVTYADKSAHDLVMMCKRQYLKKLWYELHSSVYTTSALTTSQVADNHSVLTEALGQPANENHRYLYGICKLHKSTPAMRWIAGNHMFDNGKAHVPACTLSPTEAAIGGILRLVMSLLEQKDRKTMRLKGLKRYWVVTSVDTVARDLKKNDSFLSKQPVWTRDFTTMYTNLDQMRIRAEVMKAGKEALEFANTGNSAGKNFFDVKFDRLGKAKASLQGSGISLEEFDRLLAAAITEVYLHMGQGSSTEDGVVIRQQIGVPMGGKASSEIANLFCYSVEAAFMDSLLAAGKLEEARLWSLTWRYIDDLLGFGERRWEDVDYGMQHKDTTMTPGFDVVFLGMRIKRQKHGLYTEVWPKGEGWSWVPKKYISYDSCHTPWTKKYLMKGLLVRAATICNTTASFKKGVEYYTRGLLLRGCKKSFLKQSWASFVAGKRSEACSEDERRRLQENPLRVAHLTNWFKKLVDSTAAEFESLSKKPGEAAPPEPATTRKQLLLCGINAVNAVLDVLGRPSLTKTQVDELNDHLASEEALVLADGSATENLRDPKGNYPIEVLMLALQTYGDCTVERIAHPPVRPGFYLVGNGYHWQMAASGPNGRWIVCDDG